MTNMFGQWDEGEVAELKKVFYAQAYEIVEELQDAMLRLEAKPGDGEVLKTVKRYVHTLKGDSNSVGLAGIGALCHRMEDVLSSVMGDDGDRDHEGVELLLSSVDTVHALLTRSETGQDAECPPGMLGRIDSYLGKTSHVSDAPAPPALNEYQSLQIQNAMKTGLHVYLVEASFHPECAEKAVASLMVARCLSEIGEIIAAVPGLESSELNDARGLSITFVSRQDAETIKEKARITGVTGEISVTERVEAALGETEHARVSAQPGLTKTEMVRVEAARVDRIMDLVGELIIGRSMIEQVTRDIEAGASPADVVSRLMTANSYMERTVSDLQKGAMKMRMVPMYHVFRKFPKMVRDLSLEKGKQARLEISGNETELDKGIVDALGEPLAHLIRNFIDHGIETPEERRSAGKPETGRIMLKAYHEASEIVIETADDGRGIDTEKIKRKAVEHGFLTREEADKMPERDAVKLLFLSGVSTADTVTDTSGRGVGMDAVKNAVEGMKGSIEIESSPGRGAMFRIRLPLTLAVIKALLFEVGARTYAVPVPMIGEVAKIRMEDLVTVEGNKTLLLRDKIISIISLEELFQTGGNGKLGKYVLILGAGGKKIGLLIDRIIRQQELVIKAIDHRHMQSDFVAGASILGNGMVILILDVLALLRKSIEEEKMRRLAATQTA